MNLFNPFRRQRTANTARERLKILLEYERSALNRPDLLVLLREEILAVVSRHVSIDLGKVQVSVERGEGVSTLAVDIKIPNAAA